MTFLQLKYFQVLSQVLHFTRAAEQLHVSQPSLRYAIKELEKELGAKLFQRKQQNVSLTVYGLQFLPYVNKSLEILQEGKDCIQTMLSKAPKTVNVGYPQSVAHSLVPSLIDSICKQNPALQIMFKFTEGSSKEILDYIKEGTLDMGFTFHKADWAESVVVGQQNYYLAVPVNHHLCEKTSVSFEDFAYEPQIMLKQNNSLRVSLDDIYSKSRITPDIVFEVRECNAALQYVGRGYGVSIMPHIPILGQAKVKLLPICDQNIAFSCPVYFARNTKYPQSEAGQIVFDYVKNNALDEKVL